MSVSVTMPALGESVSEGTVTRWLKKEGERVEVDEPLLEVSTDKVDTEIPSPAAGILTSIKVPEDTTVDIGVELATISDSAEVPAPVAEAPAAPAAEAPAPPAAPPPPAEAPAPPAEAAPTPPAAQATPAPAPTPAAVAPVQPAPAAANGEVGENDPTYVTPLVRKLANEQGVDLAKVLGTGVGGRIRKQDVLDAAGSGGARAVATAPAAAAPPAAPAAPAAPSAPAPAAPAPPAPVAPAQAPAAKAPAAQPAPQPAASPALRGRTEQVSRLRKVIAERMVEAMQTTAQLTTVVEVDVTKIAKLRARAKAAFEEREGVKLSFLPFFALAAVEALRVHPVINASFDMAAGTITYHDAEHLGIAVDTERGLLVPVIKNSADLSLGGIARKIADLADRTRENRIGPDELSGATFTVTNTGSRGALFDTPIFTPPQVAILGTGAVVKRPAVVTADDGQESIAIRSVAFFALSYDHRVVDGADAARFLGTIKTRLEEGAFEAALGL